MKQKTIFLVSHVPSFRLTKESSKNVADIAIKNLWLHVTI